MEPIIKVKGVGKKYNIRHFQGGYIALRDVLMTIVRSPLRFLKKKVRDAAGIGTNEEFWALKDVSFEIKKGDIVGVIGRNGAGKSTLLKILTGITPPTTGEIRMNGRVASLLEVGTGFHPELSGRENIFLNGAILGMTKKEIAKNFDSIVEFAEIEKFLDTPVKYYSSGMYVRLAFSVAAHMEPDILLVDEVLAVGDAEFQKKCLGKMEEVTKNQGRTILFVSHNMSAIQKLCKKTLLIEKGRVVMFDATDKVVGAYLKSGMSSSAKTEFPIDANKKAQVTMVSIQNSKGALSSRLNTTESFSIKVDYRVNQPIEGGLISFHFFSNGELLLFSSESDKDGSLRNYEPGNYSTIVKIPANTFAPGSIFFDISIHRPLLESFDHKQNLYFEVDDVSSPRLLIFSGANLGKMFTILDYSTKKLN